MKPEEHLIALATDAFRLCIGVRLRNFTAAEIVLFVTARADVQMKIERLG